MSLDGLEWLTSAGATPFELTVLAGRLQLLRGNWRPGWYPPGPTDKQLADMGLIVINAGHWCITEVGVAFLERHHG